MLNIKISLKNLIKNVQLIFLKVPLINFKTFFNFNIPCVHNLTFLFVIFLFVTDKFLSVLNNKYLIIIQKHDILK